MTGQRGEPADPDGESRRPASATGATADSGGAAASLAGAAADVTGAAASVTGAAASVPGAAADEGAGTGERQVPFFCPYCGEEDLRPAGASAGAWSCQSCARGFQLRFTGVLRADPGRENAARQ